MSYSFDIKPAHEMASVEENKTRFLPQVNNILESIQQKLITAKSNSQNHATQILPTYIDKPEQMSNEDARTIVYHAVMTKLKKAGYAVIYKRNVKKDSVTYQMTVAFPDAFCRQNIESMKRELASVEK